MYYALFFLGTSKYNGIVVTSNLSGNTLQKRTMILKFHNFETLLIAIKFLPIKVYCGNLLFIYILTLKSPIASAMDFLLVLVALTNSCPTDLLITAASGGEPPSESSLARRICCLNHQKLLYLALDS